MAEALREAARGFICPPALLPKAPVMNNVQVCLACQVDSVHMMNFIVVCCNMLKYRSMV